MRQFMRHPATIPIEVRVSDPPAACSPRARNVSNGGLAMQSPQAIAPDSLVTLRIPLLRPPFEAEARVVWCAPRDGAYELGVSFLHVDDAFRARMVEQLCHIEEYRRRMHREEGRDMSPEEAAVEWIDKHAAQFPNPDAPPTH